MLVLNDLKADEFIARTMGRPVLWLATILMVLPVANAGYSSTQDTTDGSAWFDCENSWASIHDSQGNEIANGSDITEILVAGTHSFYIDDEEKCQFVIPVTDELPNLKPAPNAEFYTIYSNVMNTCETSCEPTYTSGDMTDQNDDVFAIDVNANQILVLSLEASSSSIDIELHFQNNTDQVKLDQGISLALNTSIASHHVEYIPISEDGRIIVSVSSPSLDAIWSIKTELYATDVMQEITQFDEISGVGPAPFKATIGAHESLTITESINHEGTHNIPLDYRYVYSENSMSEWKSASLGSRIIGMDDLLHIEFRWDCNCTWFSSMSLHQHYDAGWGLDAPGFKPLTASSDNSSYPLITMDGQVNEGELTLHMGDYQDILRVETTGWNDSVHLVDVIVEGDIYDLQVTVWEMDQETWDIVNEKTATYSMNKISVNLDVGKGTHFIRIQHINGSDSISEDSNEVEWKIRVTTAVLEEGEEPWFPASEAVKDAADIFYWIIGILLIAPFLIFYINVNKEKKYAEEFSSRKDRLEWLTTKLSQSDFSNQDLSRALRAVSSLEWEKALDVWGEPELRHYTMGVDMAVWSLDSSKDAVGNWPLLIGLRPLDCEWSVAALRFESPEGESWEISKVEPKLLTRGYEMFLDTIHNNTRIFIQVDLQGNANSIDIHLSGMVDGEPMASKPANTIYRDKNQSEE